MVSVLAWFRNESLAEVIRTVAVRLVTSQGCASVASAHLDYFYKVFGINLAEIHVEFPSRGCLVEMHSPKVGGKRLMAGQGSERIPAGCQLCADSWHMVNQNAVRNLRAFSAIFNQLCLESIYRLLVCETTIPSSAHSTRMSLNRLCDTITNTCTNKCHLPLIIQQDVV